MIKLRIILLQYDALKWSVYWACWISVMLVLAGLFSTYPATALWLLQLTDPIAAALVDILWGFAPEEFKSVQTTLGWLGRIGRWAVSWMSDRMQVVLQVVFSGILFISLTAWVAKLVIMFFLKRKIIRQFHDCYEIQPRYRQDPTF